MKLALIALAGAAGALAACTDYPPPPAPGLPATPAAATVSDAPSRCFRTHDITSHTIADDHTLYFSVNNRDVYRLEMAGACLTAASSSDPLIMREPPGMTYACRAIDLDVSIVRGGLTTGGIPTPCIPRQLTPLTAAEVAALPPRLRP